MSTVLHPVGPQRARVYWVRRLLVVLVVAALVVLATTAVSRLRAGGSEQPAATAAGESGAGGQAGGEAGAGTQTGTQTGTETDAETDTETGTETEAGADADGGDPEGASDAAADTAAGEASPATPVACTPEAVQLTLTISAVQLDATAEPVLTATVTNVGDVPCTVDAGDVTREVLITSGDDRIWSTKDCATEESASRQLLLGAGAADAAEIGWPRVRSAEGCPSDLPEPRAGTYQAVATLGGTTSQTVVFTLA